MLPWSSSDISRSTVTSRDLLCRFRCSTANIVYTPTGETFWISPAVAKKGRDQKSRGIEVSARQLGLDPLNLHPKIEALHAFGLDC